MSSWPALHASNSAQLPMLSVLVGSAPAFSSTCGMPCNAITLRARRPRFLNQLTCVSS